jgi:hypothetical protein
MIVPCVFSCLAFALQSPTPSPQRPAHPMPEVVLAAQRDADVHNYLAMRLRLLRTGFATLRVVATGAQGRFEKAYKRKELE